MVAAVPPEIVEVEFAANAGPLLCGLPERAEPIPVQASPRELRRTHLSFARIAARHATKAVQQHPGLGQNWRHGVYAGGGRALPTDVAADLTRVAAAMAGASRIGAQRLGHAWKGRTRTCNLLRCDAGLEPAFKRGERRQPGEKLILKIKIRNFRGGRLSAAMTPSSPISAGAVGLEDEAVMPGACRPRVREKMP
jgi:hypothetical protein